MKYTFNVVNTLLDEKYGNKYSIINAFTAVKSSEKITLLCNTCKNVFTVSPLHIFGKNPTGCPKCSLDKRATARTKDTEWFKNKVKDLTGDEYTVLGEYTGNKNIIEIEHNICHKRYFITPNHFITGRRCSCNKKKLIYDTEWFKNKVKDLTGDEYTVLGEYTGYNNRILIKHNSEFCNYREFTMSPNQFIGSGNRKGHRCEVCNNTRPTNDSMKKRISSKLNGTPFNVIDVDIKNKKVTLEHMECGHYFQRNYKYILIDYHNSPDSIICPACNTTSKANVITEKLLHDLGVKFITEKSFNDMENPYCRFDFQIFRDYTSNDFILLELDGVLHRKEIPYFDNKDSFIKRQQRDLLKDDYCKKHNVKLYRIELPEHIGTTETNNLKKEILNIINKEKIGRL